MDNQVWHSHTMEYHSVIKRDGKSVTHSTMGTNLKNIMVSDERQTEKTMCPEKPNLERHNNIMVAQSWWTETRE